MVHCGPCKINMFNTIHNLPCSPFCVALTVQYISNFYFEILFIYLTNIANYYIFFTIYNFRYCYWWYLWPGSSVCSSSNNLHSTQKVAIINYFRSFAKLTFKLIYIAHILYSVVPGYYVFVLKFSKMEHETQLKINVDGYLLYL